MTLGQIKKNSCYMTQAVVKDTQYQLVTMGYIDQCLAEFMGGKWGELSKADIEANYMELEDGEGICFAKYKKQYSLKDDIYIVAHFSESQPGEDHNYTAIMYSSEYWGE